MDTVDTNPLQGAAAVLVDENLDVASLRLYDQHDETRPRTACGSRQ